MLRDAPVQLFTWIWERIWSPIGAIFLLWLWWQYDFILPSIGYWLEPFILPVAVVGICAWSVLQGVRWYLKRPRTVVEVKEKIVYREKPAQKPVSRIEMAELANSEYQEELRMIDRLDLEETEKEVAKKRAKVRFAKKLDGII